MRRAGLLRIYSSLIAVMDELDPRNGYGAGEVSDRFWSDKLLRAAFGREGRLDPNPMDDSWIETLERRTRTLLWRNEITRCGIAKDLLTKEELSGEELVLLLER